MNLKDERIDYQCTLRTKWYHYKVQRLVANNFLYEAVLCSCMLLRQSIVFFYSFLVAQAAKENEVEA